MNKQKKTMLFILLLVAFGLRIYNIDKVPSSLYIDEVDYGLQARSLIQTFHDYQGELTPFWVHSFNDVRTPIPAYFTIVTTLIFDLPEVQVRGPSVVLGTLVVFVIFSLVKLWTKNFTAAFLTAAAFAFNPWQIQFSRFAHEGISMMALYLAAVYCFFKAQDTKSYNFLLGFGFLLSLTVYTYRPMSFFVPLTFVLLFFLYGKELILYGFKKLLLIAVLAGAIILPFLYATTFTAPDVPRIAQLTIFSDPEVPIWVQRDREVDSGDLIDPTIGKKAVLTSFFFHSKPLSWLDSFANNYFQAFSTEFLFIKGDRNPRHSIGKMGHFYFIDIIALIFGFIFIGKNLKRKEFWWLLLWLFFAPIPASFTADGGQHAARLFIFSAPLLLIIGLGWWHLYEVMKNLGYAKFALFPFAGTWILFFIFYFHRYLVHYPIDSARYFGYGFKQAMTKIAQEESKYQRIAMISTKDPPMIYYLFWSETNPRLIQEYGMNFSQEVLKDHPLDKYKIVNWPTGIGSEPDIARYLRSDTLYLVSRHEFPRDLRDRSELPEGVVLVELITYPDNEVAFYLLTKDSSYKPSVKEPI